MISFSSYTQVKKLIDSKLLFQLLEDNFRKDTLISLQDEIIKQQDVVIFRLDTLNNYKDLRISKINSIVQVISKQNQILELNNEALTKSTFELTTYLDRYKTENRELSKKVNSKNKWLKVLGITNVVFITTTILFLK